MMKKKSAIVTLLLVLAVNSTLAINISGVVKNSGGSGVEGVKVRLGKAFLTATTSSDGSFTLMDATGLIRQTDRSASTRALPFRCNGNSLVFSPTGRSVIAVKVFGGNGKLLFTHEQTASGGRCQVTIPEMGRGIRIYRVCVDGAVFTIRHVAGARAVGAGFTIALDESGIPAPRASGTERIDDALMFIKPGYKYARVVVKNPDSSDIQVTLAPLDTGSLTDVEGNVYRTVRIGNQYWTAENLRTTKYNNGSAIGSGACYFYKNTTDAAAKKKWGALYMDAAANSGKLAPTGWHVPTTADWDELINYLYSNGYNYDGTTRKEFTAKALAATTDWPASTDTGAIGNDLSLNNASGFSALPAGWKFFEFEKQGTGTYFWIAGAGSGANVCDLWWIFRSLDRYNTINYGASVRLVKKA